MKADRLADHLDHMLRAATNIHGFVAEFDKDRFMQDMRTQQAVVMNLIIIGESAARLIDRHPDFIMSQQQVAWRNIRGMRNRIVHDYFEINLDTVWDTIQKEVPKLIAQIQIIVNDISLK